MGYVIIGGVIVWLAAWLIIGWVAGNAANPPTRSSVCNNTTSGSCQDFCTQYLLDRKARCSADADVAAANIRLTNLNSRVTGAVAAVSLTAVAVAAAAALCAAVLTAWLGCPLLVAALVLLAAATAYLADLLGQIIAAQSDLAAKTSADIAATNCENEALQLLLKDGCSSVDLNACLANAKNIC